MGGEKPAINEEKVSEDLSNTENKDANKEEKKEEKVTLCASCDRCRARKTKCDGKQPCGNCAARYMKKHKLTRCVKLRLI